MRRTLVDPEKNFLAFASAVAVSLRRTYFMEGCG